MWNYAQHYAMSDRSFGTTFGPSTVGALNLISGQTNGVVDDAGAAGVMVSDGGGGHTLFGNASPTGDICSTTNGPLIHMTGKNVGDFLNAASVSWGFFSAGFDTTTINPNGSTGCRRSHTSEVTGVRSADYTAFLEPFQFYESTANTKHARPLSAQTIGHADDGNTHHQYDLQDFFDALSANNFPAVSFLKAADYQDGHAGYSDPLDEQTFLVNTINTIEQSPDWTSTVIIIAYDDSDGWYDHVHNVVNGSATPWDAYSSRGVCGDASSALPGVKPGTAHAQGRCGYGPRLPLLVISPWAKPNYVSHTVTDQSSILQWIEDVFLNQQRMGGGSFDVLAGSLGDMFDFTQPSPRNSPLMLLDPSSGTIMSAK
jgi:phospholipase C